MKALTYRRKLWAITAVALLLTAEAGCSGSDGSKRGGSDSTLPVPAEIVEGGTAQLGLPGPTVFDPKLANVGAPSDMVVLDLLYDGLTRVADGASGPALAASWDHDDANLVWTFRLDPAATFASGRRVDPADVVFSLERTVGAGERSLAALRLETVKGFADFVAGRSPHLAGLSMPDADSVRIELDHPLSVLPAVLADPMFGIVDGKTLHAALVAGTPAPLDPSGSWALEEVDGAITTLKRREGRPGHLDMIELEAFKGPEEAYRAFKQGELDWALVPATHHDEAVADFGDSHFAPFQAEVFFGLRVANPALATMEMRQAIAAAIDRDAIVEDVYSEVADPLSGVIPAGLAGHREEACKGCGYDPDRARELLRQGFPAGAIPGVDIDFDESPAQEQMARLVQTDLREVGIASELRPRPLEEYKAFVVSGSQAMFSSGWIGGYQSPDAYLAPLFESLSDDNLTGFNSPAVDAALAAARASSDPAAAAEQWTAVEDAVLASAVVVPIAQFRTQPVVTSRVQGLRHALDGSVDWSAVWVVDGA